MTGYVKVTHPVIRHMRARVVSLLAAIAFVGCAVGPRPEEWYDPNGPVLVGTTLVIDERFSEDERFRIASCLVRWSVVAKRPLSAGWGIVREQPARLDAVGHADERMRRIWIRPNMPPADFESTVMHELGHALGVWDHDEHGVMQNGMTDPPPIELTEEDLALCTRFGVC